MPSGRRLISDFCGAHRELVAGDPSEVPVVVAAHSCSFGSPSLGGMDNLSRYRAIACKLHVHMNYAVTQVSATEFELGTSGIRLLCYRAVI